jgi:hypothetical protein
MSFKIVDKVKLSGYYFQGETKAKNLRYSQIKHQLLQLKQLKHLQILA